MVRLQNCNKEGKRQAAGESTHRPSGSAGCRSSCCCQLDLWRSQTLHPPVWNKHPQEKISRDAARQTRFVEIGMELWFSTFSRVYLKSCRTVKPFSSLDRRIRHTFHRFTQPDIRNQHFQYLNYYSYLCGDFYMFSDTVFSLSWITEIRAEWI